jgi:hypothetical protein
VTALLLLSPIFAADAAASNIFSTSFGTIEADYDSTTLSDTTATDWWYGCTATSAGMMMAYYDNKGYSNLVPGTVSTGSVTGAYPNGQNLRGIIASTGFQHDYYSATTYGYNTGGGMGYGYNLIGDDVATTRSPDCLCDYMGTSQDKYNSSNGSTSTYYYDDGSRLYTSDFIASDAQYAIGNAAAGICDYINSCGYTVASSFSQYSDLQTASLGETGGFTFEDYEAQIDAGCPVIINYYGASVGGHSMLGVGYDADGKIIEFYNTWDGTLHTVAWDGIYSDMSLTGVLCVELAAVPEPSTCGLIAGIMTLALTLRIRSRRRA